MIAIPRIPAAPWRAPSTFADIEIAYGRALARKHVEAAVKSLVDVLLAPVPVPSATRVKAPTGSHFYGPTGHKPGYKRHLGPTVKKMLGDGVGYGDIIRALNVSTSTVAHHKRQLAKEQAAK